MSRIATKSRNTRETSISIEVNLDGTGQYTVDTPVPFLSHMLELFSRHSLVDLNVKATGDTEVDAHHSVEDIGLVLGSALNEALGERRGIRRYGSFYVPMDEALARVSLDLSGRPCLAYRLTSPAVEVGGFHSRLFREFFQAFANRGGVTLHIDLLAGEEVHHAFEAVFKAFGRALDQATQLDPRSTGVLSTKGMLD